MDLIIFINERKKMRTDRKFRHFIRSHHPKGNIMITLNVQHLNEEISQSLYDRCLDQIDLHRLPCTCGRHDMVLHSSYERYIRTSNGKFKLLVTVSAVNPVERRMPFFYLPSFPGSLFSSAFGRRIISATFPATDWTTRSLPFCDLDMDMKRRGNLIEFYIFYLDTIDIEDRF